MSSVVRITSSQSNKPALVIKAHPSQTVNLQEWKNSSLVTLAAIGSDGSMVIGTSTPAYKLDVWGDIRTTGCLIYNSGTLGTCASEQNIKNIIDSFEISKALDKIIKFKPIKYTFKADPAGQIIIGLLTEDVEQFAPELIIKDENNFKKIDYG